MFCQRGPKTRLAYCLLRASIARQSTAALCVLYCAHASAQGLIAPDIETASVYVDKLINEAQIDPSPPSDEQPGSESSGAPRALSLDSSLLARSGYFGRQTLMSTRLRGSLDTENLGSVSMDLAAPLGTRGVSGEIASETSWSINQIDMPFQGGWYASQALGVIQTPALRSSGQQASFSLPTRLIRGGSTQWKNETHGVRLQASAGETGAYLSTGSGQFYGTGNHVSVLGLSLEGQRGNAATFLPAAWSYTAMASSSSGSSKLMVNGFDSPPLERSGGGLFQSLRWEGTQALAQGSLLVDRGKLQESPLGYSQLLLDRTSRRTRTGFWTDAVVNHDDIAHRFGIHRLAPDLQWQGTALGGNSQGGYYRWSQTGLRTQVEVQLSRSQPVDASRAVVAISQAGAVIRQYIDRQVSVGGVVQLIRARSSTMQIAGYAEIKRGETDHRIQVGVDFDRGRILSRRFAADQSWTWETGRRVTTSQAFVINDGTAAGQVSAGERGSAVELGIAGSMDLTNRLTVDLNAIARVPFASAGTRSYSINASGRFQIASGWSLDASLGLSRSANPIGTETINPIPQLLTTAAAPGFAKANSREFRVTLRYDFQGGSPSVPLGGKSGTGGGAIEGIVYLDANENGRPDAGETRPATVAVVLDGRYSVRTDALGKFSFPFVASGTHMIQVQAETLPLPWNVSNMPQTRIDLGPRETRHVELAATRER